MSRIRPSVLVAAGLCLLVFAFSWLARSEPSKTAQIAQTGQETLLRKAGRMRQSLPVADGRSQPIVGEYQVPVRPASSNSAAVSPGVQIGGDGVTYMDYQHNDDGQRQVAVGTFPGTGQGYVHFAWTSLLIDPFVLANRYVRYNIWDPSTSTWLKSGAVDEGGATISAINNEGGYTTIATDRNNIPLIAFHGWGSAGGLPPYYTSQVYESIDQVGTSFSGTDLPLSQMYNLVWPHLEINTSAVQNDWYHVCSHATGNVAPYINDELVYWRKDAGGVWQGPLVLASDNSLSHHVAVDPTSERIAVLFIQTIGGYYQAVYMESADNGNDWFASGFGTPGNPVSLDPAFQPQNISNYTGTPIPGDAFIEISGAYDPSGELHAAWVEQSFPLEYLASIQHWSAGTGVDLVASNWSGRNYTLQLGGVSAGARDLWLSYPQIAFGDGNTMCGGSANAGFVYITYEQAGGWSQVEAEDYSASNFWNTEIHLAVSPDGGESWVEKNMTETHTPACGGACASERFPSIAKDVDDAVHIFYVHDKDAGDAIHAQGSYTLNPLMYYRIDCATDAWPCCPGDAPNLVLQMEPDLDCSYFARPGLPTVRHKTLDVINIGTADLNCDVSVLPGATWLTVNLPGPHLISPGSSLSFHVTMDNNGLAAGVYSGTISITHDDASKSSPIEIPIEFTVDLYVCGNKDEDGDGVTPNAGDCDDSDPAINPGTVWYWDSDGDDYGDATVTMTQCTQPTGYVLGDGDCDDSDPAINPGAREICDFGIDNDCDGLIDDADPDVGRKTVWYLDADGDGYASGQSSIRVIQCLNPGPNWVTQACDCDDDPVTGPNVYPGAPELCDHVDNDCDGIVDNYASTDHDGDLSLVGDDCDDCDASIHPGAGETAGNCIDEDCDGLLAPGGSDSDGDGAPDWCDNCPSDPNPLQLDGDNDGTGNICDNCTDYDGDGFGTCPPAAPCTCTDDNCPHVYNPDQKEFSGESPSSDNIGNLCDNCPTIFNPAQLDLNCDGYGNACQHLKHIAIWGFSPVTLEMVVPSGESIGPSWNDIGWWASYVDTIDGNGDGEPDELIMLDHGLAGDYEIRVYPNPDADPEDTYSLAIKIGTEDLQLLVENQLVPPQGQSDTYVHSHSVCDCPYQSDFDEDGFLTALDLSSMIDILFGGDPDVQDPGCPAPRADFDCDGFSTALDLSGLIDHLFSGGDPPCDPCNP